MKVKSATYKLFFSVAAVSVLAGLTLGGMAALGQHGGGKSAFNVMPVGKITPWAAMKIAAKASGGRPFQATYEFDEGQWVYGVMVVKGRKLYEVELDPTTGKVADTEVANPAGEAKEMQGELNRALKLGGR